MPPIDAGDDWDDGSDLDALTPTFTGDDESYSDLDAVAPSAPTADDAGVPVVQVANPDGTVLVTAFMNGSIARVDLSAAVTRWPEAALGSEITEVADAAAKRATAVVHVMVVEMMVAQGVDLVEAREFVTSNLPYATPAQADSALERLSTRPAVHAD
jgi:hypothetical protein